MTSLYFASGAFLHTILSHARHSGLNVEQLLASAGFEAHWLFDQREHVPAYLVENLWRQCEVAGAGRQFGYELMNGMATSCLQGLNILLDSAATLRDSLNCFIRHMPLVTNYVQVELKEQHGQAHLHLRGVSEEPHFFGLDAATVTLVRNIARRVGRPPKALFSEITLAPKQAAESLLLGWGLTVKRNSHPVLSLPLAALELPLLGANAFLHQSLLRHSSSGVNDQHADGLQLAQHWLKAGDQPIERIANRLGYRQPSNFIRAFRKRFGITPKQFRLASL